MVTVSPWNHSRRFIQYSDFPLYLLRGVICSPNLLTTRQVSGRPTRLKMVVPKSTDSALTSMRNSVREQGDRVKELKLANATAAEIKSAVEELMNRKKLLEDKEILTASPPSPFDRSKLEDLLKQRFFYDQSFAIYGGVQGLYDYGPMGCAMKANLLSAWRQHFILEDQLLEVDCSMLTPSAVLQASGHVERFTDLLVKDVVTGECFRADHLIKAALEIKQKHKSTSDADKEELSRLLSQLDNFGKEELDALIRRFHLKAPVTNNDLTESQEFNLMFATSIGPTGQCKGYLRPETAQGIFVNFQRLLQFNQGRIPFGAAQIGSAFRNEISPRSGLIRVREFSMAEIEYFVDPSNKDHPKFHQVRDEEINFFSACDQMDGLPPKRISIGIAVDQGIVANQTLGYFIARIHQFLVLVGVDENRLRFRQHLSNEMAHYARDCWDAECLTSYGWIECVGCADRSCFDLAQHTKATGTRLVAEKRLAEPRLVHVSKCVTNKQALGKAFRGDVKSVIDRLSVLSVNETANMKTELSTNGQVKLDVDGKEFILDDSMVQIKDYEDKIHVEEIVPNVIEPSFGIGRILYSVFEHSFRTREGDEQRTYLSVPTVLAPYKCSVLPLSNHPDFQNYVRIVSSALTREGVSHRIDESSGSIGRRYARTDQIAIPYGITIDFDTMNKSPPSVTLRERDSMKQIRVPLDVLSSLIRDLSTGVVNWSQAQSQYPAFEQQETVSQTNAISFDSHEGSAYPALGKEKSVDHPKKKEKGVEKISKNKRDPTPKPYASSAPVGETATADDWQSVSEDLDDANKKVDAEADDWSSATELTDAHVDLLSHTLTSLEVNESIGKPINLAGENCEPDNMDMHADDESAIDTSNVDEQSRTATLPSVSVQSTHRKPISWSDWGRAVTSYYRSQEALEKNAEKLAPTQKQISTPVEQDDIRSSFSGYEADQEDNVFSKSIAGQLSPTAKDLDTMYELSPAVRSLNDDDDKEKCLTTVSSIDNDNDGEFPTLVTSDSPHHGLFVGRGWPGEKSNKIREFPQNLHSCKAKSFDGTIKKRVIHPSETSSINICHSDPPRIDSVQGWTSVLAQMVDKGCVPEVSQFQPNNDFWDSENLCSAVKASDANSENITNTLPEVTSEINVTRPDHVTLVAFHGLFSGPGWSKQGKNNGIKESGMTKLLEQSKQTTDSDRATKRNNMIASEVHGESMEAAITEQQKCVTNEGAVVDSIDLLASKTGETLQDPDQVCASYETRRNSPLLFSNSDQVFGSGYWDSDSGEFHSFQKPRPSEETDPTNDGASSQPTKPENLLGATLEADVLPFNIMEFDETQTASHRVARDEAVPSSALGGDRGSPTKSPVIDSCQEKESSHPVAELLHHASSKDADHQCGNEEHTNPWTVAADVPTPTDHIIPSQEPQTIIQVVTAETNPESLPTTSTTGGVEVKVADFQRSAKKNRSKRRKPKKKNIIP